MTDEQNTTFIPEPKKPGDLIRSSDWNAAMDEIARLGQAMLNRVNRAGDRITGPLQVTDAFSVDGDLTAGAALSVTGPLTVEDAATINGDLILKGALKPEGALTVADLTVTDTLNLEGALTIADLTVNNALNLNGAFNLTGPLTVTELTVTNTFKLEGALTLTGLTVSGNVGIGIAEPQSTLDVNGDIRVSNAPLWLREGTSKHHGIGYYGLKEREENRFADTDIDGPVVFGYNGGALGSTGDGEKLALAWDKAGNVGIGTTNPQRTLEVNGDVRIRNWLDMGPGGDGGRIWVKYSGAPYLIISDADDPPRIQFQQTGRGDGTEDAPEFQSWIGHRRGRSSEIAIDSDCYVNGKLSAKNKEFHIDHPTRAGYDLVHACIEGPENGVYYRGTARLQDGRATVQLPAYFAALTRPEDHTVQLTALGPEPFLLSYTPIVDGQFTVYGSHPEGAFAWHVTAVRADVPPLEVEVEVEKED